MRKAVALFLCGVMMTSFVLSGCQKPEETEIDLTGTLTEPSEQTEPTEETTSEYENNFRKVASLYAVKMPNEDKGVRVFADGVRGGGFYSAGSGYVYFGYESLFGESRMEINLDSATLKPSVTFMLSYGDTRFYGRSHDGDVTSDGVEAFIDEIIEGNTDHYEIYDGSALADNAENIKKDLPILYSRFIKLSENAFWEVNLGLEDMGISLGSKYRDVDPAQPLSSEVVIKNEHIFEKGVCSDCGMLWCEYFYKTTGELKKAEGDWRSVYGQRSNSMFASDDYVQCTASGKDNAEIYYQHRLNLSGKTVKESCTVVGQKENKKYKSFIIYDYAQGEFKTDDNSTSYKYIYEVFVKADPGSFDQVFESKEAFKQACTVYLFVVGDDGVGRSVWDLKEEDEIKEQLEHDGCTYFTKDEIVDRLWDRYPTMLESLDKGLVWLDTSLADMGINWKK